MAHGVSSTWLTAMLAGCISLGAAGGIPAPADAGRAGAHSQPVPGAALFADGPVRRLRLDILPADLERLRQEPRESVRAVVRDVDGVYADTAVHLKGRSGSFRSLDGKPSLTLSFDKFVPGQRFHGLSKIHLNNSVEDPSYLHECLGAELFRAAGVPAPRVAHALVELNGRKLGLYLLKEGFTQEFLGQYFHRTDGNLYENDPSREEPGRMRRDSGRGPDDRADLKILAAITQETDPATRWRRLPQILDVDRFLSFMALEVMTGHRDGYCLARNNFRLYHDSDFDRFVFLPHGMDQLFGRIDLPLRPRMSGPVARAVMDTAEGRRCYRERVAMLLTNVFNARALTQRADRLVSQLGPALDRSAAREIERAAALVKQGIVQRAAYLARAVEEPEPQPMRFENGVSSLRQWLAVDAPAGGKLEQANSPDTRSALGIHAGPVTAASWRSQVLLEAGRYRFEGLARTSRVAPLKFARHRGAGLRVTGGRGTDSRWLSGDQAWQKLVVEFEVTDPVEAVTLICELRASGGEAWFDLDSLRLVRLP